MNLPVRRTRENAVVAGVCAGLARRWNVDPLLLRIAIVILALASGLGLILYGIGVLMLPADDSTEAPVRRLLPFTRSWPTPALVAALAGAGLVLFGMLGGWSGSGFVPILVVAGVWYVVSTRRKAVATARPVEPTPYERAAEAWRVRLVEHQMSSGARLAPLAAPAPAPVPPSRPDQALVPAAKPRRSGRLWWLALGLIAVSTGVVALTQPNGPGYHPGAVAYLAVILLSLGVTLLIATWRGRPRLMGTATMLVMLATIVTMVAQSPADLSELRVVDETRLVRTSADLPPEITGVAGDLTLDLSRLTLDEDQHLRLELGAGEIDVQLPTGVRSEVTWQVGAGDATVFGESHNGLNLSGSEATNIGPESPVLRVDVVMQAGSLVVRT